MTENSIQKDVEQNLSILDEVSKTGFLNGYFRLQQVIDPSLLPSERLRKTLNENLSYEYQDGKKRLANLQLMRGVEARERSLIENFERKKKNGTDAFFGTITLVFLIAITMTFIYDNEAEGGAAAFNVLMTFPFIYVPAYIYTRMRVNKIFRKAHQT